MKIAIFSGSIFAVQTRLVRDPLFDLHFYVVLRPPETLPPKMSGCWSTPLQEGTAVERAQDYMNVQPEETDL